VTVEHPPDEEPVDAAVTVSERVDRLELGVYQRSSGHRIMRRAVRIVDQIAHQEIDSVGRNGDVRSPVWCRATDPAEAVSPRALVLGFEIRRRHEDPVPVPKDLERERPFLRQRCIDGTEVIGDRRGRATD
jgi:hypothetical protein